MKNRIPFAALTFAFTIAGACIAHGMTDIGSKTLTVIMVALVGALAAGLSAYEIKQ